MIYYHKHTKKRVNCLKIKCSLTINQTDRGEQGDYLIDDGTKQYIITKENLSEYVLRSVNNCEEIWVQGLREMEHMKQVEKEDYLGALKRKTTFVK